MLTRYRLGARMSAVNARDKIKALSQNVRFKTKITHEHPIVESPHYPLAPTAELTSAL